MTVAAMAPNRWITLVVAALVAAVVVAVTSFHFGRETAKRREAAEAMKETAVPPPYTAPGAVPAPPEASPPRPSASPPPPPSFDYSEPLTSSSHETIPFTDPTGKLDLSILRILVGDDCWYKNVVSENELKEAHERNKELVYFQVAVKNLGVPGVKHVTFLDFFLLDNGGELHRPQKPADFLQGDLETGRRIVGGVLFHTYAGAYPVRLLYRTGYVSPSTGNEIYAYAEHLERLAALQNLTPYFGNISTAEPAPGVEEGTAELGMERQEEVGTAPATDASSAAEALPDGFRGVKWGTRVDSIDGLVHAPGSDEPEQGLKAYKQGIDETFYFDTIELKDSTYYSNNGVLVQGSAGYDCSDSAFVVKVLVGRYGNANLIVGEPGAPTFMEWGGKDSDLQYHHTESNCRLLFESIGYRSDIQRPP